MEEETIIIEESNVEKILDDVLIREERLKEDRVLILNNEQIVHELTNIFFKNYENENINSIKHKVNIFIDLLKNEKPTTKFTYPIRPIILCNKHIIVNDDKTDIDSDFQNKYLVKVQKLQTFINQFDNLNNDKNSEYLQTVNTLYNLQKPFVNLNNDSTFSIDRVTTDKTVDAFRHFVFKEYDAQTLSEVNINKFETFRIIPKIQLDTHKRPEQADTKPGCIAGLHYISIPNDVTIYDGDAVDIIGYTNLSDDTNNIESFDITQYIKYLHTLSINTSVNVYFNDFIFDKNGKIIETIDAIITANTNGNIVLQFNKLLIIDNIETKFFKFDIEKASKCFIYDKNYKKYKFHKSCIKKDNIIFYLYKSSELTLEFITPQTISEIFFNNMDLLNDMHDFSSIKKLICNNYNIPFDNIPTSLKTVLSIILKSNILENPLNKQQPKFKFIPHHESIDFLKFNKNCYKELYLSTQKYVDSTLLRYSYLKDKRDYGYLYLLTLLKTQLKLKYEKLNKKTFHDKIENIKKEINQLNFKQKNRSAKKGRIAKIYKSIEDVEKDYGNIIFYDKELDPTKYKILSKFNKNLPYNELKYKIIEELVKDGDYFKFSREELETEADYIINGQRIIIPGDLAVVYLQDSSILYTRRNISDKKQDMWIKTMKTPFHLCSENLPSSDDLENVNILALDPFDILCKKIEEIRKNNIYQQLISEISIYESILSFIDDYDNIINDIDKDIEYYKYNFLLLENNDESIHALEKLRRTIKIILPSIKKENYSEYTGNIDEFDIDKIYNNIDFNDKDEFHPLYLGKQDTLCQDLTCNESNDILNVFIIILKIDIPLPIKEYIINQVNVKYSIANIQDKIEEEKQKIFTKNINKTRYNENIEYKLKADNIIAEKIKQFEIKLLKSYYYNIIVYIAALLNLIIMTEYPNIIIKNFVPKCTKHFSYIGHPIASDTQQQTLTIFFACIIASLGTPDDIKFDQFSNIKLQDIVDTIKIEIDKILEENTHIALKLQDKENALTMVKNKKTLDFSQYLKLNVNFRPNFGTNINTQNISVQFIKNINNIIKNDRFFKHNMFHIPFISNSCCIESLNKNTNFYDYFTKNNAFKQLTKKDIAVEFTTTIPYIPKSTHLKYDDLFIKKHITTTNSVIITSWDLPEFNIDANFKKFINENIAFKNDPLVSNKIDIDALLQQSDTNFKFITNLIKMHYNKFDNNLVDNIYILLISMQSFNKKYINLRNLLLSFIQFKLPTIISKIFNAKKMDSSSDLLYNEILSLATEEYRNLIGPKIKDLLNNSFKMIVNLQLESKEESDIITNSAIIVYCLFKFLYGFLYLTINDYNVNTIYKSNTFSLNQLDKNSKKNLNISSTIIYYILISLTNFFNINDCDNEVLKNKIEELRERRKELLMENLEKEDEARKTQLLLKKFGIPIKIDEKIIHKDILVHDNDLQEQQNYSINEYKGDNADDVEYEEELYANNLDY